MCYESWRARPNCECVLSMHVLMVCLFANGCWDVLFFLSKAEVCVLIFHHAW